MQPGRRNHSHRLARWAPDGLVRHKNPAHRPQRPVLRCKRGSGMRRWLRQHRYAAAMAVRRLLAHPFSSLSNILVIALTLAIPIIAASALVSAQPVVRQISVSPEITLFMKPGADADAAKSIASRIRDGHDPKVQHVRVVPREQALARPKSDPDWADALSALPKHPFPDANAVTLVNGPELAKIGRAHVRTPVPNAQPGCLLLLEKKKQKRLLP